MIRFIKGTYLYYDSGAVVVETESGIGFRIIIPDNSGLLTAREGDSVEVFTYMQVKEDAISLYGFDDIDGLKLFEQLIGVNGVGPKAGLAIMSLGTANQIKSIIAGKDSSAVSMAQGVGKKTAERIILELHDKVSALPLGDEEISSVPAADIHDDQRSEAVIALTTLGYTKKEAEQAVGSVAEPDLKAEDYIRKALKYLL